ncbi:MAG: hypothetical protein K2O29_09795 [Ruminococcus sp.]|nr:hypothetical protein [Ruminococcus sp.]
MMMKKIIAAMASIAISATAFMVMSVSAYAADINIPYTQSENSLTTSDDTKEVRVNICNTWSGNNIEDISTDTAVSEKIVVKFTVDGIGSDSTRTNEDGTTENLCAYLIGSVGTNSAWSPDENGNETVAINGDGDYTVTWTLDKDSDSIDNLILQSNIRIDADKTLEESGITITVNSISTIGEEVTSTTTTTTESSTTTTTTSGTTSTATGIAQAPAPTGDKGVGAVLTVITLAGVTMILSKKKNN